jgi:hypothetical protein
LKKRFEKMAKWIALLVKYMRQNSAYKRGQLQRRCDQALCGYSAAHGQSQSA